MAKTKHAEITVLVHETDAALPRLIVRHCDYCDIWIAESIGASCEDDCGFEMLCPAHRDPENHDCGGN